MQNANNSLAHRQVEVIRKNLLSVFRFTVKALIDKACFCSIDDGCEEFVNFCATVEHILQHRLRPSKVWYLGDDRSHFWLYIKAACHRQDLRDCITNIDNIENIRSPVAKGRAFVRCALMEKRLSEYLGEALKQTNITRRYYKPGAIMLGEEAMELCGILLGLNSIDFGFCLKGENYDTVECPLAISYSPFMKFRQSPESLYSDLEEMRELSCGSSLASEDDGLVEGAGQTQDTPPTDHHSWSDRYSALHKRYMRLLEQKSFLEELTASQGKALQSASTAQQEVGRVQQEAALQSRQYEAVILELQAQVARMKTINESLQQQLMAARGARIPLVEMGERRGEMGGERGGQASRFAAAMGHKMDSDRHSLTSSCDRGSVGRPTGVDTRSLASALSEISVDVVGRGGTTLPGFTEDSQSMVPLVGSLADLHLDLDPGAVSVGVAVSESSTVANPEQATPVVSISSGLYTSSFLEVNGNSGGVGGRSEEGESNVLLRKTPGIQITAEGRESDHPVEGPAQRSSATGDGGVSSEPGESSRQVSGNGGRETTVRDSGLATGEGGDPRGEQQTPDVEAALQATSAPPSQQVGGRETTPDSPSQGSAASEPEELVPEGAVDVSGGEGRESSSSSEREWQDPRGSSPLTSSKESMLASSDKDYSSEPEVLAQEDSTQRPSSEGDSPCPDDDNTDTQRPLPQPHETEAAMASGHGDVEDTSDPEILDDGNLSQGDAKLTCEASSQLHAQEGASSFADLPSSDREETSDPELLTREDVSDEDHGSCEQEPHPGTGADGTPPTSHDGKPGVTEPESSAASNNQAKGDHSSHSKGAGGEAGEKEGGSESGSSDENKDTWDMLSDANPDINSS